jgi:hypothetical protein
MKIYPFRDGDTFTAFSNMVEKTIEEISGLDNQYVLKSSMTELETYYVNKVMIEPLVLYNDQYHIENQSSTQIDVSRDHNRLVLRGETVFVKGTRLEIAIPYTGDELLWRIRASSFSLSGYPEIDVRKDVIVLDVSFPDDTANTSDLKSKIDTDTRRLGEAVQNLKRDVDGHNSSAPQSIRIALQKKRQLAESTIGVVVGLGIPIKRRDEPLAFTAPIKRREIVSKPKSQTEPYKPEPVLSEEEYQHILKVVRGMSLVIERSSSTFSSLDEETIRTHFLLQLNGHYDGGATGETFNAEGKTDVLIRIENRNIFIAECKFWKGPKAFSEAIDQLLSYLSWRDTKCALLIFNKTKDSLSVRQKMHQVMESRSEHKKTVSFDPNGDARYIFVKEAEPGREIIITTQVYDIPTDNQ